ncbi:sorbitol dehydrogenase-like isoform X2, partial [Dinothrombium tinctorium]
MMNSTLSVVIHGINDVRIENTPFNDELKAKGKIGNMAIKEPHIIGHEVSATVVKVGSEVKNLKIGDHVAIEPSIACGDCKYCREGNYNLCDQSNDQSIGLPPTDGGMRKYFRHHSSFCHKLPEKITLQEGALVEPIACALYGVQRAGVKIGDKVLVCGAGAISLLSLICAKAYGAEKICVIDKNVERLKIADTLGADCTIEVKENMNAQSLAESIERCMGKVDVSLECTGSQICTQAAILASGRGAKIAIVGIGPDLTAVPLSDIIFKEIDLLGVNKSKNNFPLVIRLLETGKINVKPLITHIFPIESALDAFKINSEQKGIKVLIEF